MGVCAAKSCVVCTDTSSLSYSMLSAVGTKVKPSTRWTPDAMAHSSMVAISRGMPCSMFTTDDDDDDAIDKDDDTRRAMRRVLYVGVGTTKAWLPDHDVSSNQLLKTTTDNMVSSLLWVRSSAVCKEKNK